MIRLADSHEIDSVEMRAVYADCLVQMMDAGEPVVALDAEARELAARFTKGGKL